MEQRPALKRDSAPLEGREQRTAFFIFPFPCVRFRGFAFRRGGVGDPTWSKEMMRIAHCAKCSLRPPRDSDSQAPDPFGICDWSSQVKFLLSTQIKNSPRLVPGAGSSRRRQKPVKPKPHCWAVILQFAICVLEHVISFA